MPRFFISALKPYRFRAVRNLLGPNQNPGAFKVLGGFGQIVVGVVVLADSDRQIGGLPAIIAAGGLALEDVDPVLHH